MNHDACDKAYAELRADKIRVQEDLTQEIRETDCLKARLVEASKTESLFRDALASARVLVAMDTLPENVPNEAQRQTAVETLALIDSLIK